MSRWKVQPIAASAEEERSSGRSQRCQRALEQLLGDVRACRACEGSLAVTPRPVLRASGTARVLVVGQAPGARVHATGIPWDDPSGQRLRQWMGISRERFYDERFVALLPMAFCYPGRGKSGDLPPPRVCAELWRERLLAQLPDIQLTLLIGQYAQAYHLGSRRKRTLTETVRAWREYQPAHLPLPHPSGRNNIWLRRNAWFEAEVVPALRDTCQRLGVTSAE